MADIQKHGDADPNREGLNSFGKRFRNLRKERGWSLQYTSELTGVPISTLSRIETNKVSPSLDIVMKIINRSKINPMEMKYFPILESEEKEVSLNKKDQGISTEIPNIILKPLHYYTKNKLFNPIIISFFTRSIEEYGGYISHDGDEFVYLLSGELDICFENGDVFSLHEGDSLYFSSQKPHAYIAKNNIQAKALIVASTFETQITEKKPPSASLG